MNAEQRTQKAILDYLSLYPNQIDVWRQNTGAAKYRSGGKTRFIRFSIPGAADITGILADGRRIEIEVKSPKGRQSRVQHRFQERIERKGGIYILARSVDDVMEALKEYLR